MNIVLTPGISPIVWLESHRKSSGHLDRIDNWQIRSCLMVKKPENMICYVNASAGKLNPSDLVKLFHSYSILPSFVILLRVNMWIIIISYSSSSELIFSSQRSSQICPGCRDGQHTNCSGSILPDPRHGSQYC